MEKVTVVSPVYNVAPYLKQCIESLINQSYKNWEAIFVDDGSQDGSAALIESYAEADGRIRLIRQCNSGAGQARNNGLAHATGAYIYFLDPDDWMDEGLLEDNVALMREHNLDAIVFQHRNAGPNGLEVLATTPSGVEYFLEKGKWVATMLRLLFTHRSPMTPWNKIYRKTLIDRAGIRFSDMRTGEDATFNIGLGPFVGRFAFNSAPYYNYRVSRAGSLIYCNLDKFLDDIRVIDELRKCPEVAVHLLQARVISVVYQGLTTAANFSLRHDGLATYRRLCRERNYVGMLGEVAMHRIRRPKLIVQYLLSHYPLLVYSLVKMGVLAKL
jgi:glycosyltransferase involved in cell wall biosynthesis